MSDERKKEQEMKAKKKNSDKHPVPLNLRNWAKRIRLGKKFGSVRYPAKFKEEILSLLQNGIDRGVLCQALAINPRSLQAWEKAADEKKLANSEHSLEGVRELMIIPDQREIQDRVKIQMGGKVWIEAPANVMQGALLRELAALGAT